jgi:integrase
MSATGARIEANEYIRSLIKQSGIKSKIEESVIHSSIECALRSAKRLKAIGKSSEKQIVVKAGKLAVWHYILADLDLSCLNEDFIWDLIEALCQQNIANSTINKYLIELRAILEGLIAKGLITRSVKIPTLGTNTRDLIEMDLKTFEIFKRHYAKNETERNMLDTAYFTGARKTNVLEDFSVDNLKLSDEQDGRTLRTASMIWLDAYSCKGKRRMDILLQREARAAIEKQIAYRQKNGITHPNLFALDNQGTNIKIDRTRWQNALKKANVDLEFTFHQFRHNRAYQVLMNGGTFEEVRQLLGLSSTKMVEVVYGHVQITDGAVKSGSISHS